VTRTGDPGVLLDGELMDALFPDHHVVRAQLDGRLVDAVFRVDAAEHQRRLLHGLRAVHSPRLLRQLADLPRGVLVNDPVLRADTALLPDGVVEWSADGIGRLLEPPVVLDAVVVPALGPARTRHVWIADRFAPYARRFVVTGEPRVDAATLVAASVRGVGLVTRLPEPEVVTVAAPASGRAEPGKGWLLAEQAYGAWIAGGQSARRARRTDTDTAARLLTTS
jgi:hypothetical protein